MSFVIAIVAVAGVIIGALAFAATKPNTVSFEREVRIAASPDRVFALIDDFHAWKQWSPQDRDDTTFARTFSGATSGVGAVSNWQAKGQGGKGRAEIVESRPGQLVVVNVDFEQPCAVHNVNRFALTPDGSGTHVVWSMRGDSPYILKVMSLFVNMNKMMGQHFEAGLANLKAAAEGRST